MLRAFFLFRDAGRPNHLKTAARLTNSSGFVMRCSSPTPSHPVLRKLDLFRLSRLPVPGNPTRCHRLLANWVAKSVAGSPAYRKTKCNREFTTAWTTWRYLPSR
jgi:hypothetical protein